MQGSSLLCRAPRKPTGFYFQRSRTETVLSQPSVKTEQPSLLGDVNAILIFTGLPEGKSSLRLQQAWMLVQIVLGKRIKQGQYQILHHHTHHHKQRARAITGGKKPIHWGKQVQRTWAVFKYLYSAGNSLKQRRSSVQS